MSVLGNFISAVPRRPGFDLYCMDPQPTDATPNIVVYKKAAGSDDIERKLTFAASSGLRTSKIAANTREFGSTTQQASVFYQLTSGNIYEYRIDTVGNRYQYNVDSVLTSGAATPALGTSLATVLSGENRQTVFLFYQAADNRIYYVFQTSFGTWSIPTLVTSEPTEGPTTLSAFAWAESDPNATTVIDVVCVALNPAPGRFAVHARRQVRGTGAAALQPYFEPVLDWGGPATRGPHAAVHVGVDAAGCCAPNKGDYVFFTQLREEGPSRIWERAVPAADPGGLLPYTVVVETAVTLQIPARGTSLAAIYDPPEAGDKSDKGDLVVIYVSPEGVLDFKDVPLP